MAEAAAAPPSRIPPPPLPNTFVFGLLAAFIGVALVLRGSVFGNPNALADDAFYALVGARMHEGVLPYVGVWDRKPFGLFALYWAITGISREPIAWQLAATLSASLTALVIFRLVLEWGTRTGGVLAGLAYLVMLGPLDGFSGQTPVFYNFPMALAAWLAWRGHAFGQVRRFAMAAGLCGIAMTIKQTALFESGFLMGFALWSLWRRGAPVLRWALGLAGLCAGPTLAIAAGYALIGHFPEWWHAMVTSNLAKAPLRPEELRHDAASLAVRIAVPLAAALWGLWRARDGRGFLGAWLVAGFVGVAAVPHFFPHYALPWLVPLCVAGGIGFGGAGGLLAFALVIANGFLWYDPFDRDWNRHAIASTRELAAAVAAHDGGRGLFVYDGPVALYELTGRPFLTPLVFTHHLNQAIERNVSHLDTDAEVARVLAGRPGAVVSVLAPRNFPVNWRTWTMVQDYVHANCRRVALVESWDHMVRTPIAVWGDCAPPPPADRMRR